MATITLHHLERSRSHRVLWLLEELGLEYSIERYQRDPKTMRAPGSLKKIHPLGKAPVLQIDDVVVAESGAIMEHVVETVGEGRLRPELGTEAHRRYRFFLHYAEGSLMPPLLVALITSKIRSAPLPFFIKPITKTIANNVDGSFTNGELESHRAFLESELEGREFLTGDELSAADVQMSYPLEAMESRAGFADQPRLRGYLERLRARPAYQRAIEKGGPVML